MKLWEANRFKINVLQPFKGNLDDWQDWFLGTEKRLTPAVFARDCLKVGAEELEKKLGVDVFLDVNKNGRKVIGYEMQITDNRQPTTAEVIKKQKKIAIRRMFMILFNLKQEKKKQGQNDLAFLRHF